MTRLATILALPIITAAAVYLLAQTLAGHDWLVAIVLGAAVVCGICGMAPSETNEGRNQ